MLVGACLLLIMSACGNETAVEAGSDIVESETPREMDPVIDDVALHALTASNSEFAFDLLRILADSGENLFYSPYSVSAALAMALAGADGNTLAQMADALRFTLDPGALHSAFNYLDLELDARDKMDPVFDGDGFQLNMVNALWGQTGYAFLDSFLDTLAANYGAGVRLLNFAEQPEPSRQTINNWVSEYTNGRIQDLLPPGSIDMSTRLILTNAIYFNAPWFHPFDEANTQIEPFTNLDGTLSQVPMMHQAESLKTGRWDGGRAVELPYNGLELAMVILVPDQEKFESFVGSLTFEQFSDIVDGLEQQPLVLGLPRFEFAYDVSLVNPLIELGMTDAFEGTLADFSNIDGTRDLVISDVLHKAFVAVDEAGTEAAAATAVVFRATAAPTQPAELIINRPFVFAIRDIATGTILFIGHVTALPSEDS